jgi:hypothetical protein
MGVDWDKLVDWRPGTVQWAPRLTQRYAWPCHVDASGMLTSAAGARPRSARALQLQSGSTLMCAIRGLGKMSALKYLQQANTLACPIVLSDFFFSLPLSLQLSSPLSFFT